MTKKPLLKIVARHKRNLKRVTLYYPSIAQAAHFNPNLENFEVKGPAEESQMKLK